MNKNKNKLRVGVLFTLIGALVAANSYKGYVETFFNYVSSVLVIEKITSCPDLMLEYMDTKESLSDEERLKLKSKKDKACIELKNIDEAADSIKK